jgi:hypothetical protein
MDKQPKKETTVHAKKSFEQEIAESLTKSRMWVLLNLDDKGVHVRTPEESQLVLLAVFLADNPDLYAHIQGVIEEFKQQANEEQNTTENPTEENSEEKVITGDFKKRIIDPNNL